MTAPRPLTDRLDTLADLFGVYNDTEDAVALISEASARIAAVEAALRAANAVDVVCPECGSDDDTFWRGGESPSWECPCVGVIFDPLARAALASEAARTDSLQPPAHDGGREEVI